MPPSLRLPTAAEQHLLSHLRVRPVTEAERPRWNAEVAAHHYLQNATLVGEHLCDVTEYQSTWLALLGWSAPARHLRPRDTWIGWSHEQGAARRHFLANNARFCILVDPQQLPNLASRALALCAARLAADWQARWGHPIVAVESPVDGQCFRGTAYEAAGWKRLEDTSGDARVAEDSYDHIALEGKRLRRSGDLAIASAVGLPSQRVHATVAMGPHDSELVAVRQLLAKTEFTDLLLALDARHTQHETTPQTLCGHGADYLVPLKDNQATMLATAQTLLPESLSPFARRSSTRSIAAAARGRNAVAPGSNTGALSATSRPLNWAGPGRRN